MLTPEQKLWRTVLEQAYADAEGTSGETDEFGRGVCAGAQHFLRADTPHDAASLRLICDFAEVPEDRVIAWARQRYPAAAQQDAASLLDVIPSEARDLLFASE